MTYTKPRNRTQAIALSNALRRYGTVTNSAKYIRAADEVLGACKTADGCERLSKAACDEKGGEYGGDDTECESPAEPPPEGAAALFLHGPYGRDCGCGGACSTARGTAKPAGDFMAVAKDHARTSKLTLAQSIRKLANLFPSAHAAWVKAQHTEHWQRQRSR